MKKILAVFLAMGILLICSFARADDEEGMAKWRGVQRIERWIGVKEVFDSKGNKFSANGQVIFYPWLWETENGVNLLGLGAKANYWDSSSGHGLRLLGEGAYETYRSWGKLRLSLLAGFQDEEYGKSKPHHDLYGVGAYTSLGYNGEFPKTELWAQYLWANGSKGGKLTGIIDIGGRQFFVKDGWIKPYFEANLSIGTPDNYLSLGIGIGITDRREIFYLSVGPQFDLRNGGSPLFVNVGVSTSNAVDVAIRANAAKKVIAVGDQNKQTPKEE
jgi:hypothetical protein